MSFEHVSDQDRPAGDRPPVVVSNGPNHPIREALRDGRTIDAGVTMRTAIRDGRGRLIEKAVAIRVVEDLINTRDLTDESLLVEIARWVAGTLAPNEKARLYGLATRRGKIETSFTFI